MTVGATKPPERLPLYDVVMSLPADALIPAHWVRTLLARYAQPPHEGADAAAPGGSGEAIGGEADAGDGS